MFGTSQQLVRAVFGETSRAHGQWAKEQAVMFWWLSNIHISIWGRMH